DEGQVLALPFPPGDSERFLPPEHLGGLSAGHNELTQKVLPVASEEPPSSQSLQERQQKVNES
ncbi:hypothetical protein GOODEAATRI_034658, partial [Goodea atripinnis]